MASIFSKIIAREIPAYILYENEKFISFLDVFPLVKGHTLVVPKIEIDYIFEMEDSLLGEMMIFSKHIAKAIGQAIPCVKVGLSVIGLEVPHAHIHLMPIENVSDMDFSRKKMQLNNDEMMAIAESIKKFL